MRTWNFRRPQCCARPTRISAVCWALIPRRQVRTAHRRTTHLCGRAGSAGGAPPQKKAQSRRSVPHTMTPYSRTPRFGRPFGWSRIVPSGLRGVEAHARPVPRAHVQSCVLKVARLKAGAAEAVGVKDSCPRLESELRVLSLLMCRRSSIYKNRFLRRRESHSLRRPPAECDYHQSRI